MPRRRRQPRRELLKTFCRASRRVLVKPMCCLLVTSCGKFYRCHTPICLLVPSVTKRDSFYPLVAVFTHAARVGGDALARSTLKPEKVIGTRKLVQARLERMGFIHLFGKYKWFWILSASQAILTQFHVRWNSSHQYSWSRQLRCDIDNEVKSFPVVSKRLFALMRFYYNYSLIAAKFIETKPEDHHLRDKRKYMQMYMSYKYFTFVLVVNVDPPKSNGNFKSTYRLWEGIEGTIYLDTNYDKYIQLQTLDIIQTVCYTMSKTKYMYFELIHISVHLFVLLRQNDDNLGW